jgi:hypothetical protein
MRRFFGRLFIKIGLRICGFRPSQTVMFNSPEWNDETMSAWTAEAVLGPIGSRAKLSRLNLIHTDDAMGAQAFAKLDAIVGAIEPVGIDYDGLVKPIDQLSPART